MYIKDRADVGTSAVILTRTGQQHLKISKQNSKELFGIHSSDSAPFLDTDVAAKIGVFAQGKGSLTQNIQIQL